MIQTLEWTDKGVRFIDQTKLPMEEVYVTCKTHEQVADVIRNMVVRGAPAIGVAAAMGIALGVNNSKAESSSELKRDLDQICDLIGRTRPTAVNLFWAIRRMQEKFERIRIRPIPQIKQDLIEEAQRMHAEDIAANQAMGRHGATLMPSTGGVLTHCNAGALATAGYGTALGVIRAAVEMERAVRSRQALSPRSLMSAAPTMMRKISQRKSHTTSRGAGMVGKGRTLFSGQRKAARKPVSRS